MAVTRFLARLFLFEGFGNSRLVGSLFLCTEKWNKNTENPCPIEVIPKLNIEAVTISNLQDQVFTRSQQKFNINTKNAGGRGNLEVKIIAPSNKIVYARVTDMGKDQHQVDWTPIDEGSYRIDVLYDGQLVPGAPWLIEAVMSPDPTKVRVYGPGLRSGVVKEAAPFTIDTRGAGAGGLGLTVEGPCEAKIECVDNGDCTCSVTYLPTEAGDYTINVLFADQHVPGSPFTAIIRPAYDASKVTCSEIKSKSIRVNEIQTMRVDCSGAGVAQLQAELLQSNGHKVECTIVAVPNQANVYKVSFVPTAAGKATLNMSYGDDLIRGYPKILNVLPAIDTSKIRCYGDGLEGNQIYVDVSSTFTIDAKAINSRGGAKINIRCVGPSGVAASIDLVDNRDGTYTATYIPYESGLHNIEIDYEGVEIPSAPFKVNVTEGCVPSKVKAYGPGLQAGTTDQPARFTVDTRGAGTGGLGLAVEGPSDARITCKDNKDGTCSVEYYPTAAGDYEVHITYGREPVPGSPFIVPVRDEVDAQKVVLAGPGITDGTRTNISTHFTIDASRAGVAVLEVNLLGPKGESVPVHCDETSQQIFSATYTPEHEGIHNLSVKYANQIIPCCPIKFRVEPQFDASKVTCKGAGISQTKAVSSSFPVEFTIDATHAGEGVLTVQITDPQGKPKKASVSDNSDGTYTVRYVPDMVGKYAICVRYGGDEVPHSPFRVKAIASGDASKAIVSGSLYETKTFRVSEESHLRVDAKRCGQGLVTAQIETPSDEILDIKVIENGNGTFDIAYTPLETGHHKLNLRFGGIDIPDMPIKCEAFGRDGKRNLRPDQLRPWDLVLSRAPDNIEAVLKMPSGRAEQIKVISEGDGSKVICYDPVERGLHHLDLRFCDR